MKTGPRNLITDVEGLRVGNADDGSVKSGVTVLAADRPITASVHVMGGAPGTRETDLLAPDKLVPAVDALVLSGVRRLASMRRRGLRTLFARPALGLMWPGRRCRLCRRPSCLIC